MSVNYQLHQWGLALQHLQLSALVRCQHSTADDHSAAQKHTELVAI